MFIYILVLVLTLPTKEIPFTTYGFLEQHSTARACKEAQKELTEGLSKEQADKVFCISVQNQSVWSKEI